MGLYASDQQIEDSLKKFAQGDTFSLFKLALENLYDPKGLIRDTSFIVNMFKNSLKGENKKDFLELLIDKNIDFSDEYHEKNFEDLQKFNTYWKGALEQPVPLLFSIIPYLNDAEIEYIVKEGHLYQLSERQDIQKLSESLLIDLFEKGHNKSNVAIKDSYYYFFNSLSMYDKKIYPGQTEEKTLEDILSPHVDNNPALLPAISKYFYVGLESYADRWLTMQLDKDRRDNIVIQKFFDTVFDQLSDSGKERIISKTLYKNSDLDFTMLALEKIGVNSFSEYKPKHVPIWLDAADHKNKAIYRRLLRSGVSVFDYYKGSTKTFLSVILDGLPSNNAKNYLPNILAEQKIDYKTFIKELLDNKIDEEGKPYTNFSLLISSMNSTVIEHLNLQLEDLANYSKKLNPQKYETLKLKEKFELLNDVMDRTFLADTYVPVESFSKKHIEKKAINFNLYIHNQYYSRNPVTLVDEHLKLIEQVDPETHDYRGKYFKIVSQIFDQYGTNGLEDSMQLYKTYMKMIDYVATDKSLDWSSLADYLSSEKVNKDKSNFYEGALNLYNYLQKVCLSHTLTQAAIPEKKKYKI